MKTIKEVLMQRDNMSAEEADDLIAEAKETLTTYLEDGDFSSAEDICAEFFGLEPDYIIEQLTKAQRATGRCWIYHLLDLSPVEQPTKETSMETYTVLKRTQYRQITKEELYMADVIVSCSDEHSTNVVLRLATGQNIKIVVTPDFWKAPRVVVYNLKMEGIEE